MSSEVYFTSDTHFDHTGALRFRPMFSSVEEMNETIVERWNNLVKRGDRVYHMGDFGFFRKEKQSDNVERMRHFADRLNGQIHLILGNHDDHLKTKDRPMFASVNDLKYIKVYDQKIMLCHYAMRTWRGSHRGSWQLYGHSHGNLKELDTLKALDVGVDPWDFTPVSFEQVKERLKDKRFVSVDHHG